MIEVVTATLPERGPLLADCARSVALQTLPPAAWHVRVDHDREGPANVLNGLVDAVKAEWLFRLDDDDLLEPDHFAHLKPYLTGRADIVYSWCRIDGPISPRKFQVPFDPDRLRRDNFIPSAAAIRTSLFRDLGGYDPHPTRTRHEDWDFWLRALEAGARFLCVPIPTWTYRLGAWEHRSL
jgi:GT2 family glycosyltransferase